MKANKVYLILIISLAAINAADQNPEYKNFIAQYPNATDAQKEQFKYLNAQIKQTRRDIARADEELLREETLLNQLFFAIASWIRK